MVILLFESIGIVNITALFKKGSKSASQNYIPVICKLMKSIIKDEIIKHLKIFKLIKKMEVSMGLQKAGHA